jgi:putative intracellular protease/amidase
MKTILMVLAPENFREIEYLVPKAFFEECGYTVMTTSSISPKVTGSHQFPVTTDFLLSEVDPGNFEAIVFVGGRGSLVFAENLTVKKLALDFQSQGKIIAAICAAPRNLLTWGMLEGKSCTGHNWDDQFPVLCTEAQAKYLNQPVVIDGQFVTADGPEASENFALEILKKLK